jgi:hypothetical protein
MTLENELTEALQLALNALEAISDEMTVGDRFTNAGQHLLDALMPARAAIANAKIAKNEPVCNPHPKAPHGFSRNSSHSLNRYVCECEGWDAWEAGYSEGMEAGSKIGEYMDVSNKLQDTVDDLLDEHPHSAEQMQELYEEGLAAESAMREPIDKSQWWYKELEGFWGNTDYKVTLDTRRAARVALNNCFPASVSEAERVEPVKEDAIWYMRDNHTFKRLNEDVPTALIQLETELNEGNIYGMLCSKRKGFENIHNHGTKDRVRFLSACEARLKSIYSAATPAAAVSEPLTDEQIEAILKSPWIDGDLRKGYLVFARAIEAAHNIRSK